MDLKKVQIQAIKDILNHADYKNVTGLEQALGVYVEEQEALAVQESNQLVLEEVDVAQEEEMVTNSTCDCAWEEWSEWSGCSATCANGTMTKTRRVGRNATNGGADCTGDTTEEESCDIGSCRNYDNFPTAHHLHFSLE